MPVENLRNNKRYNWIGFAFEYLLSNKLSNISSFYVPDQKIIQRAFREGGYSTEKIDGQIVYHIGKATGINVGFIITYSTDGKSIDVNVNFINSFTGASIFSKQYINKMEDLFTIVDNIVENIVQLTAVTLSPAEKNIVNRQVTRSIKAFENFCLGYMENEKPKKNLEAIVGLFRKAIRADSKFWEAYYNLGIAYFNDREYNQALQQFDIIIKSLPNFEKPYFGRGLIYLRKKEYKKAKNDFIKVTEFNPNDYKPFYYLGKISIILKQFREANKHLKKAADINPDYANIYYEMGNIYFINKKYQQAIPHYKRAVELDASDNDMHKKLGESYYRVQIYYSAYIEFKTVLENDPTDPVANFMLGITVYKQAVLNELIAAFLEMFDPEVAKQQAARTQNTGSVQERSKVYKEMVSAFYMAQKNRNRFLEATFNLALTYHDMSKVDSALIYYNKAIVIQPDLIRAHIKMAQLYEDQNEKQKALDKYKEVVMIDPSYFAAHPTLGPMHQYINIVDVVLRELDQKLNINKNDLQANQSLAKIYYAQGFYGKAANIYRKVLSINPNDKEAKKMLAKLDKR